MHYVLSIGSLTVLLLKDAAILSSARDTYLVSVILRSNSDAPFAAQTLG